MNRSSFSIKVLQLADASLKRMEQAENLDMILDELRLHEVGSTVADLLFSYFRHKGIIDFLIQYCSEKTGKGAGKKKTPAKFQRLLAIAFTQAKYQKGIDEYAAVDVAVGWAKRKFGRNIGGFINAVLRRMLVQNTELISNNAPKHVLFNFPKDVFQRWQKIFGEEKVAKFAVVFETKPKLSFRVIGDISDKILTDKKCQKIELPSLADGYCFFETTEPGLVFAENWLDNGMIYIQDPSTLSPCNFYHPHVGDVVYDLCSAPGGKSLILSERMSSGLLVAADVSFKRQQRTIENLQKGKCKDHTVIVSSAVKPAFKLSTADFILLDVPCSNTGVCRRRPDVLWNLTDRKMKELLQLQAILIKRGAELLKPGSTLVYSTCSIEKQENQEQVALFLSENPNFSLVEERLLLPSLSHDGGYAALLQKK